MKNISPNSALFLLIMIGAWLSSCTGTSRLASPQNTGDTSEAVLQADRAFSKMSEEKGLNTAFIAYAADNAVLLRPGHQPITGRENIRMYMTRTSDQNTRLTWSPATAVIAASGDMAYSYGTYLMETLDMEGKVISSAGTYTTVWQKDPKGFWKFVMQSGNAGLRP